MGHAHAAAGGATMSHSPISSAPESSVPSPAPIPRPSRLDLVWNLLEGERGRYGLAIACTVGAAVFGYGTPLAVQAVLDGVLAQNAAERAGDLAPAARITLDLLGGREFLGEHLWVAGLFVAVTAALAGACLFGRGALAAVASQRSIRRLRDRLHGHLQRLPGGFFDRTESGDLLQRLTSDVETVQNFLGVQVVEMGRSISLLLVALPLMLATDTTMTGLSVILMPAVLVYAIAYFRRIRQTFLEKDEAEGRLTARAQENLTGIRVVRSFDRGDFERERFRLANDEHRQLDQRLFGQFAWFWSISDLICLMQMALVLGVGLQRVVAGVLSVGDFAFFLVAVNLWLWPMRMLGRILADLGKATVAMDRLQEVLDEPEEPAPATPSSTPTPRSERPRIDFVDVRFRHRPDAAPALDGVSFSIEPGETVALLGPSGSGKSTLIDLLLRLADPQSGRILIDGVDIATRPRREIRAAIASVLQQPFLYSRSIRDNVAMAAADPAGESEIAAAASSAAIDETIRSFPEGYATAIGERGISLSGGQRQRLAIARALLRDAPILLLDDALSAVDTETERRIVEALAARHGRRTTIVVAHRLSTLEMADRIVVLEGGRVREIGSPAHLRSSGGLYQRLWAIQEEVEDEGRFETVDEESDP
jgi:ATP-binding cassette subfamily B protein